MAKLLDSAKGNPPKNVHKNNVKRKHRVCRVKKKNAVHSLTMFLNNFAGLKGKMTSFTSELNTFKAAIFTGQETHSTTKGLVKIKDFEIFEAIIENKERQGSIIGVHKALKPILIEEYSETFELIVIQITAANKNIKVISGKGPHENYSEQIRLPFFQALELEVVREELSGSSVLIELNANNKLGPEYISHDKKQSPNGKILAGIVNRQKLTVGNGMKQCRGDITRQRTTVNGDE